jgi:hypothetical protein
LETLCNIRSTGPWCKKNNKNRHKTIQTLESF